MIFEKILRSSLYTPYPIYFKMVKLSMKLLQRAMRYERPGQDARSQANSLKPCEATANIAGRPKRQHEFHIRALVAAILSL